MFSTNACFLLNAKSRMANSRTSLPLGFVLLSNQFVFQNNNFYLRAGNIPPEAVCTKKAPQSWCFSFFLRVRDSYTHRTQRALALSFTLYLRANLCFVNLFVFVQARYGFETLRRVVSPSETLQFHYNFGFTNALQLPLMLCLLRRKFPYEFAARVCAFI